jgi:AcrR family transcriptional regulator
MAYPGVVNRPAPLDPDAQSPPGAIARSALYEEVWSRPLRAVAEDWGLSPNGLAKICDRLLIPYPGRGYWTKRGQERPGARPPLPPAPQPADEVVVIAAEKARSRRPRTRLSPEERRAQLIEAAARIVAEEGLHAVTLKRVARELGVSEAQAHNYFSRRTDLLVALARRELDAMDAERVSQVERAHDNLTRVTLSTLTYLRQVAERGALIQVLLNSPEVRQGLRSARDAQSSSARRRMTHRLSDQYGVADDLAYGATVVLTSLCLRAGRLLAERKIPLDMAERLSLAMVTAGNRAVTRAARS